MEKDIHQKFNSVGIPEKGTLFLGVDCTPDLDYSKGKYFIPPLDNSRECLIETATVDHNVWIDKFYNKLKSE